MSINKNGHREVFLYPAPTSSISVYCERIVDGSRQTGYGSFQQKLELGKTYNVYCNEIGNNRYKLVAKDADSVPIEKEPTNLNRVKFFIKVLFLFKYSIDIGSMFRDRPGNEYKSAPQIIQ